MSHVETHSFQTEAKQLLNLMIHSLYSNKEIFLRELISNASDAIDKVRFSEITNQNLLKSDKELGIKVSILPESNQLVIEDNGIGMSKEELIANLGTIANSGTKKFLEQMSEDKKKDSSLIGQFGVGFYAAFMVADKVKVESLSAIEGAEPYTWESKGDGEYTLVRSTKQTRGTRVELTLREDQKEFLDDWRIKNIVTKYSNYITYPILMDDKEGKEERLNKVTPVWAKSKKENKPEDYNELYKQISFDWEEPLSYEHMNIEGLVPFNAVLFVPQKPAMDLYARDAHGLHLYVKRVSIMEKCQELIPEYLRFVKGVVETDELPLNVSREILQQNTRIPAIKKQIVKKLLSVFQKMATDESEKYLKFYESFGPVLKEGFHFDPSNQEALSDLVRFHSSLSNEKNWVSLKEYSERKGKGQNEIYYISAPDYLSALRSPHLEALRARNLEVLFMIDPVDEWVMMSLSQYKDMKFKNIAKGDLDLKGIGDEPQEVVNSVPEELPVEELAGLMSAIRAKLGGEIKDVKVSKRLHESPCCIVTDENAMSAQMERILKASGKDFEASKKILEVNPKHVLIKNLAKLQQSGATAAVQMEDWVEMLYDTALLAEGSPLKNPGEYSRRLVKMMERASEASL